MEYHLGSNNPFGFTTINLNQNGTNINIHSYNSTPSGVESSVKTTPEPPDGFKIQDAAQARVSGKLCISCNHHIPFNELRCSNCHIINGHRGYIRISNYETPQYPPPSPPNSPPQSTTRCDTPPPPRGYVIQDLNEAKINGKHCHHCYETLSYETTTCPSCHRCNGHRGYVLASPTTSGPYSPHNNNHNNTNLGFFCLENTNLIDTFDGM